MKRIVFLTLLAVGVAACSSKDNVEPPAPLKDFKATLTLDRVWTADAGDAGDLRLGLVLATDGQKVYAADHDGTISAFDASNGRRVWSTDVDALIGGGPAVAYGRVVVSGLDGSVIALSADDGKVLWKREVAGELIAAPAVGENTVVVRTVDGRLAALAAQDGHSLWNLDRDVPKLTLRGTSAPVIDGDTVFAGYDSGKLYGVGLQNGQPDWTATVSDPQGTNELERLADIDGPIQVGNHDVYAVGYHGKVVAVAAESGQVLWSRDLSSFTGVEIDANHLYATDSESRVWELDRASGTPVWSQPDMRARNLTVPVPFDGTVVAGDLDGYVHFMSQQDGKLVARAEVGGDPIHAPPLVVDDKVVILSTNGDIAAFRIAKGGS